MPRERDSCGIMLTTRYAIALVVALSAYYVMADHGAGGHSGPGHAAPVPHHEPAVSYSEPQYYSRKCHSLFQNEE